MWKFSQEKHLGKTVSIFSREIDFCDCLYYSADSAIYQQIGVGDGIFLPL